MIRVAIVGLGGVTRNIHLPAYEQLADTVQVVAGCDNHAAARLTMEKNEDLPAIYDDPREMIERTQPDVVSICTPPAMHREQTLMALEYGCHVFCEKPMADRLQHADDIIEVADRTNRLVVINNQFPYMNIHLAAKQRIGSPEFGELLFLHAWQTFRPTEETEAGWRAEMRQRVCLEFGVHVFELVRFFFEDEPVKVWAHMPHRGRRMKSDAFNIMSLEFADGRAASIVLDRLSKGPEQYLDMRLDGEFSSIHTSIGGEVRFEAGIHTKEKRPFFGLHLAKGGSAVLQNGTRSKVIGRDGINPFASATAYHFRNFINAIQNGGTPPGSAADNRNTLALVFAAYDSAQSGRAIEMRSYLPATHHGFATV